MLHLKVIRNLWRKLLIYFIPHSVWPELLPAAHPRLSQQPSPLSLSHNLSRPSPTQPALSPAPAAPPPSWPAASGSSVGWCAPPRLYSGGDWCLLWPWCTEASAGWRFPPGTWRKCGSRHTVKGEWWHRNSALHIKWHTSRAFSRILSQTTDYKLGHMTCYFTAVSSTSNHIWLPTISPQITGIFSVSLQSLTPSIQ